MIDDGSRTENNKRLGIWIMKERKRKIKVESE
jgi:hypothetical protein